MCVMVESWIIDYPIDTSLQENEASNCWHCDEKKKLTRWWPKMMM